MPDVFIESTPISHNESSEETIKKSMGKSGVSENHFHGLAAFCQNPHGMSFQTQDQDESVLLFLRRHVITNVPWIIVSLFLLILPPVFLSFSTFVDTSIFSLPSLTPQTITIVILFYYLIVLTYAFINFMSWFFNITLITQKRIFDLDFTNLVYHDVTETKLSLVEDVRYTQSGFIRSFFNYGDLFVQTAAEQENIEGLAVPSPAKAVRIISDLIGKGPQHD